MVAHLSLQEGSPESEQFLAHIYFTIVLEHLRLEKCSLSDVIHNINALSEVCACVCVRVCVHEMEGEL